MNNINYFELVPSDINNIIISYLLSDELKILLNTFNLLNIDWSTVNSYHFDKYLKINLIEYVRRLEVETLIKKLKLE